MDKTTIIAVVLAVLMVAGAALASAKFLGDGSTEEEVDSGEVALECGAETCNGECGGSCGIPSCGCGR